MKGIAKGPVVPDPTALPHAVLAGIIYWFQQAGVHEAAQVQVIVGVFVTVTVNVGVAVELVEVIVAVGV